MYKTLPKFKTFFKSSVTLGTLLYLSTDQDAQRREKILFRSLKLLGQVSLEDKNNLQKEQEEQAQNLYELLSEAGGTFVKLGQMIATNTYLFPDAYVKAMIPLLDQCPTNNFQIIKRQLESELKQPLDKIFKYIDEKPVASASIAQVHRAILLNGDEVAIKIQHKKVGEHAKNDIKMVNFGLGMLYKLFDIDYRWLANDIHESMQKELDFKLETQNAERIREIFKDNKHIYIPKIYHEYTTEKVIIMEFVHGYKITEKDKLDKDKLNKLKISDILNKCFADQVFDHGFVHCDPHPGNILVRPIPQKYYTNWLMGWESEYNEPQIILLDHGIYRDIDINSRLMFAKMWKGIILGDEKSNDMLAKDLNVDMNELYYPNGSRELDTLPRIKLLKSMLSFKCFEAAEDPNEIFKPENNKNLTQKQLEDKKVCYDYAKRLHQVVANILAKNEDRNLFFLFKNNLYIRNIDIELGYEVNNVNTTLDYSLKLIEKNDEGDKGYMYYTSKYLAKTFLYLASYIY